MLLLQPTSRKAQFPDLILVSKEQKAGCEGGEKGPIVILEVRKCLYFGIYIYICSRKDNVSIYKF